MKFRTPLALAGAAALAVTTGLVTTANPSQAAATKSYAYGVAIGGQGKQPYAEYPKGPTSAGGELPSQLGPLASGGVLTVTAGNDQATAKVTNLTLGAGVTEQLPDDLKNGIAQLTQACTAFDQAGQTDEATGPLNDAIDSIPGGIGTVVNLPTAEQASDFCNALLDAEMLDVAHVGTLLTECNGDTGSVELTDVSVLGAEQPVLAGPVPKNTSLLPPQLDPLVKVTLNHQYTNDAGGFVVEGLRVEAGGQELAVLASTTCGEPLPQRQAGRAPAPRQAEAPEPVQQRVPVTG